MISHMATIAAAILALAVAVVAVQGAQADNRIRWTYTGSASSPEWAETPVLANEYVLILHGTKVTALNATFGIMAWSWDAHAGYPLEGKPFTDPVLSADKTVMYIGICDSSASKVYALATETGELIWKTKEKFLVRISKSHMHCHDS